jgi:hypothetical protein
MIVITNPSYRNETTPFTLFECGLKVHQQENLISGDEMNLFYRKLAKNIGLVWFCISSTTST